MARMAEAEAKKRMLIAASTNERVWLGLREPARSSETERAAELVVKKSVGGLNA